MAEQENKTTAATPPQPGQVVAPGGNAAPPAAAAAPPVTPAAPAPPAPLAQPTPPPGPNPNFSADSPPADTNFINQAPAAAPGPGDAINWTASEFVAHEKSSGWYLGLTAAALVIAGFVYLITRDIISTIVVLVGAAAFGILGSRKPRQQQYNLDAGGVTIGHKRYDFSTFRSFAVMPEGAFSSIVFMPLKRFAQLTTIYYAPEDEDKIVDLISQSLPFEERKPDAVDSLMKRVRF
jgi:hypothetical protein